MFAFKFYFGTGNLTLFCFVFEDKLAVSQQLAWFHQFLR